MDDVVIVSNIGPFDITNNGISKTVYKVNQSFIYDNVKNLRETFSPIGRFNISENAFFKNNNAFIVFFRKDFINLAIDGQDNQNNQRFNVQVDRNFLEVLRNHIDFGLGQQTIDNVEGASIEVLLSNNYVPAMTVSCFRHSPVFSEVRFFAVNTELLSNEKVKKEVEKAFLKMLKALFSSLNSYVAIYVCESDDVMKPMWEKVFVGKHRTTFPSDARQGVTLQMYDTLKQEGIEKTDELLLSFASELSNETTAQESTTILSSRTRRSVCRRNR